MRTTILPMAVILTKACKATVSMMDKGCFVTSVLPLRCFLILLPNFIHVYAIMMHYFQQEYSQPPILPLVISSG